MRIGTLTRIIGVTSLVALLTVAALVRNPSPARAATRPTAKLVPASGTLLGAYVDPDAKWVDNASAQSEVTTFESQLGRKLAVDQHYYSWTNTFPSGLEQWDIQGGRTPLVTWEPFGVTLDQIINGSQDGIIRARADGMKALGTNVFLRFAHEMNGDWYPWSGAQNGNNPAKYVSAWKHVHDVFVQRGATNVVWVWSPNNDNVPSSSWNAYQNYYPGDGYTDWVAVDGYNWGTTKSWSSWRSFTGLFGGFYNTYASRKPIMIAETSSAEAGGSKSSWIASMSTAIQNTYPSIAAIVWFHVNKESDWRANSTSTALAKFKEMANLSYFKSMPGGSAPTVTPVTVAPAVTSSATSVSYENSVPANIRIRVRNAAGLVVNEILPWSWRQAVPHTRTWDGRDAAGNLVPAGTYTIVVGAMDGAGLATYVGRTLTVVR
jgi:beta-mannanase